MKVFKAKRSVVKGEYNGIEDYLKNEFDLKKEVSLKKIKDGGMHGNRKIVWDTPDVMMQRLVLKTYNVTDMILNFS
jgi:hypothetical protein